MQDDYNGAFEAVEHLIKNGYGRIAHIAGSKGLTFTQKRLQDTLKHLKNITSRYVRNGLFIPAFRRKAVKKIRMNY